MPAWSTLQLSATSAASRLDAEFFRPEYLAFEKATASGDKLGDLALAILHPTEITRLYREAGIRILLAQNIRPNRLDMTHCVFMEEGLRGVLARNRLRPGDVLVTRTGANFGDAAAFLDDVEEVYACADCLIVRPSRISAGYLSTFLTTAIGRALLNRGVYGAGQPHISPTYLRGLRIPRLGDVEAKAHACVTAAYEKTTLAAQAYADAESTMTRALRLDGLSATQSRLFSRSWSWVATQNRLDAEYLSPRTQAIIELLSRDGHNIGDVAVNAKRRFKPNPGKPFDYIEITDITNRGTAESHQIPGEDAPSRATWKVRPGDVITSTVRPIRRLSAIIDGTQNDFVCSSGFAVLAARETQKVDPELLLVYLRLPAVCELLDLHTTASMYPAVATPALMNLPFALPPEKERGQIVASVRKSLAANREAISLLAEAKLTVEHTILG